MDEKSQEYLRKILLKDVQLLTSEEIKFLKARRSYLKQSQLDEYKSVIEVKEQSSLVSYGKLLKQAKALGYNGPRIRRAQLEAYIKEHSI
jgi:hypothetical protein